MRIQTVSAASAGNGTSYSAQVVPDTQVDVAFRTDGYVTEIAQVTTNQSSRRILQPGDTVARGTVLARVDDAQYRDQVATADANFQKSRAALRKAEQDFKRASALQETNSITAPDYDAAHEEIDSTRAAVAGARAQLDEAQLKLKDTALVAPLDGIVLKRNLEIGTLVHAGTVGFSLANTQLVKVVFGVPDVVLKDLNLGDALEIRTASLPDRRFTGTVTEIAPAADDRTRVFDVAVTVDNADGLLRPGMVASLVVGEQWPPTRPIVDVPIGAVVESNDGGFAVYVVNDANGVTTARLRPVETGPVIGNRIVVLTGLQDGETVIVTGSAQVRDGQAVSVLH